MNAGSRLKEIVEEGMKEVQQQLTPQNQKGIKAQTLCEPPDLELTYSVDPPGCDCSVAVRHELEEIVHCISSMHAPP